MKPILGSLGANTLVILMPEESRLIREALNELASFGGDNRGLVAFNAGIKRGTERLQGEFDELQREKKKGGSGAS